uniref:Uncharacterized protein n=1 Tax=Avena sativa TaxID=4498 RepID=A0ACD5YVL6_AVESA
MAEFALGLTKTAVEGTLSRVKSAIEEEGKLRVRVQNDLVFITGEFQMMQSFLKGANAAEDAKKEVVRTWVRQIRDLAFDVEDCVEFVIHLDKRSAWSSWFWRVVPSCVAPVLPLDVAIAEIQQLKARVVDVSDRNTRYNLLISTSPDFNTNSPMAAPAELMSATSSAFHMLREVWEAAGKHHGTDDLRDLITSRRQGNDLQVISVWGSSNNAGATADDHDLGEMSIIRRAYDDPEVCQEFKTRAWVKVMHPLNPGELLKNLLIQLSHQGNSSNDSSGHFRTRMKAALATDEDDLDSKVELMQQLSDQRYLVVLEKVSTMVDWDIIRAYLPESNKASRIIVSTQHLGIALSCTGSPYQVADLRRFSDGQSICAFFKKFDKLSWQLKRGGVISVWGSGDGISTVVSKVYNAMIDEFTRFDNGVKFERHNWVEVPNPFNPKVFFRQLFASFHSYNLEAKEIAALDVMGDLQIIEVCRKILHEDNRLMVINGLQSEHVWDLINKYLLYSEPRIKVRGGCIVVITKEKTVAQHCADGEDRVLSIKDLEADMVLHHLTKGYRYYEYGREALGSIFTSDRIEEASKWPETLLVGHQCIVARDLSDELSCSEAAGVVSLWGIAGVGKSFVAKSVYYDLMFNCDEYMFKHYTAFSWVDVPHRFNLADFSRRLFLDFHSDNLQAKEAKAINMMEGQDPIEGCRKFLCENKCLIVIDGLRSTDDWDLIKAALLFESAKGSVILVVTNETNVATHCATSENLINLKGLELDVAFHLLRKIASKGGKRTIDPEELEVSKHIIAKCGGLPQVIASVGEWFAGFAGRKYFVERLYDFMESLEELPEFYGLRSLFSWMRSYFDACSDSLKPCIFYLSVFPIGHNIRKRRLLWRWVAEGYSKEKNYEENLFLELVKLSIIQQSRSSSSSSSKFGMCQVNGFFHEYIMCRPMEDNLVFVLDECDNTNSRHAGAQHLTVRSSWHRDETGFKSLDLSRLRSLTVFGEWRSFFISVNMKLLRVLDLEDTLGLRDDDLKNIGRLLPRLKFLSLRGCKDISYLPDSLDGLRQLLSLDVRHTKITMLPRAICKLQKLQYIRAGSTYEPPGVQEDDSYMTVAAEDRIDESSSVADLGKVDSDGTAPVLTEVDEVCISPWRSRWARELVVSCSSLSNKFISSRCRRLDVDNGGGVEVPGAWMGNLTALHTLGVVNVTSSGKAIFKEIKKLTQLRELGVSGINKGNIEELFRAISDHSHLQSLSVRVDKDDFACLDGTISLQPPKKLTSIKLYGDVYVLPVWMKKLCYPKKIDLEVTILTQEDIDAIVSIPLPRRLDIPRLCVKPIQDGEIRFGKATCFPTVLKLKVLRIDCSSSRKLRVTFREKEVYPLVVEVLKIQCSSGSSLRVSGIQHLQELKEVWLKGSYGDQLKQDLLNQLSKHKNRPVLKLAVLFR